MRMGVLVTCNADTTLTRSYPPPSPHNLFIFVLGDRALRTLLQPAPNLKAVVSKPPVTVCTYSLALYIFCRNIDVTHVGAAHD